MPLSFQKFCLTLICIVSLTLLPLTTSKPVSANEIKLPMLGDTTSGIVSLQQEHELGRGY